MMVSGNEHYHKVVRGCNKKSIQESITEKNSTPGFGCRVGNPVKAGKIKIKEKKYG